MMAARQADIFLYNTRTRGKELFVPIAAGQAGMYCCGPTVYNFAHLGNMRTYIFEDLLRRTLARGGYDVRHVMNVTDVGHLQSDADEGEDKMILAMRREGKSPWDIARFYEDAFLADSAALDILRPQVVCRATDHVNEMIGMIQTLMEKGYAYRSGGNQPNVYFDTQAFPAYRDFARLVDDPQQAQARVEADRHKRHPNDFVLWFTLEGSKYPNQAMQWDSPWGRGFPGWHIECSAMACRYLGPRIDIHCGGIDHIPVHHTNEIAQSEACLGHAWVNIWMHGAFLEVDQGRMSKSSGSFLRLKTLTDDGYRPAHYRYLCLTAHYRGALRFSYDSLDQARTAYDTLCHKAEEYRAQAPAPGATPAARAAVAQIDQAMRDDLNAPVALAALWAAVRGDELSPAEKLFVLDAADSALGLAGVVLDRPALSAAQREMLHAREEKRQARDWAAADDLRAALAAQGIGVKDRPEGSNWYITDLSLFNQSKKEQ